MKREMNGGWKGERGNGWRGRCKEVDGGRGFVGLAEVVEGGEEGWLCGGMDGGGVER